MDFKNVPKYFAGNIFCTPVITKHFVRLKYEVMYGPQIQQKQNLYIYIYIYIYSQKNVTYHTNSN